METSTCFCVAAAAIFTSTLMWRLRRRRCTGFWIPAFVASLYFVVPPVVHGFLLLVYSFILVCVMDRRAELLPVNSRVVLVTGCDSGFGHELAKRLSEMGVMVFAGVLDVDGVGAQQLRERANENLRVLQLDVTDSSQIEAVYHYVCSQVAATGLWGLVNNAGILQCPMDAELQPITMCRRFMDVNFLGAVKMCQVFLPLLRRSRGRIVNVSSMAAEVPLPSFSSYGASKAALSAFSKVMRMELSVWGVKVSLIQPSGFRTNIFGNSDDISRYREEVLRATSYDVREDYGELYISSLAGSLSKMSQGSAEDLSPVVDNMCHALLSTHPRPTYTPGQMAWLLPVLHHSLPTSVFEAITTKLLKAVDHLPAGVNSS